jgi:hypothetical protein
MYTSDGSIVQPTCSDPSHPPTPVSHEPASNETRSHAIAKMPPPVRHSMTMRQQSRWWSQMASLRPCRTAFFPSMGRNQCATNRGTNRWKLNGVWRLSSVRSSHAQSDAKVPCNGVWRLSSSKERARLSR